MFKQTTKNTVRTCLLHSDTSLLALLKANVSTYLWPDDPEVCKHTTRSLHVHTAQCMLINSMH